MPSSIILRFSDAETPTIPAHQKVIDVERSVWWGWWKKRWEPIPLELLQDVKERATRSPVQIGLVNRKGIERFYVATCANVEYLQEPILSPQPSLTPNYYNESRFPAWFNFTHIEEVDRQTFLNQFKYVPYLDPTLYEVRQVGDTFQIRPKQTWTMEAVPVRGETILHISDLHFGDDHGFPLVRSQPGQGIDRKPLVDILLERIDRLRSRIGIIVVSGDLITRGDSNKYVDADRFLRDLLNGLGLERNHCVIVPGNHDLYVADIDFPTRQYAHEEPYRLFVRAFFEMDFQTLERVRRFQWDSGQELIFVELNSARIRSDKLKEYGYVAKHRYNDLLKYVHDTLRQDPPPVPPLFFAVLHHHILPVSQVSIPEEQRPVSLCLDAGELIDEFQKNGIQFALHGHQHTPFVGMTSRAPFPNETEVWNPNSNPLFVLGCGSSGVKSDRLPAELPMNTFALYTPTEEGFHVTMEKYTDTQAPHTFWSGILPVRLQQNPTVADVSTVDTNE